MELTSLKRSPLVQYLTLFLIYGLGVLAFVFLLFSATSLRLPGALLSFAEHHYFLTGFILFVAVIFLIRFYLRKTSELHINPEEKSSLKQITIQNAVKASNLARTVFPINIYEDSKYIRKEKIKGLHFKRYDVLHHPKDKRARSMNLQRACSLGNLYKHKVIICFRSSEGLMHTITTVWHADEDFVVLKGGVSLPVHVIQDVIL